METEKMCDDESKSVEAYQEPKSDCDKKETLVDSNCAIIGPEEKLRSQLKRKVNNVEANITAALTHETTNILLNKTVDSLTQIGEEICHKTVENLMINYDMKTPNESAYKAIDSLIQKNEEICDKTVENIMTDTEMELEPSNESDCNSVDTLSQKGKKICNTTLEKLVIDYELGTPNESADKSVNILNQKGEKICDNTVENLITVFEMDSESANVDSDHPADSLTKKESSNVSTGYSVNTLTKKGEVICNQSVEKLITGYEMESESPNGSLDNSIGTLIKKGEEICNNIADKIIAKERTPLAASTNVTKTQSKYKKIIGVNYAKKYMARKSRNASVDYDIESLMKKVKEICLLAREQIEQKKRIKSTTVFDKCLVNSEFKMDMENFESLADFKKCSSTSSLEFPIPSPIIDKNTFAAKLSNAELNKLKENNSNTPSVTSSDVNIPTSNPSQNFVLDPIKESAANTNLSISPASSISTIENERSNTRTLPNEDELEVDLPLQTDKDL